MHRLRLATRSVMLLAVSLLLAGVASGVAPLVATAAQTGPPGPAASFSTSGALKGVAATSATNAWAVGSTGTGRTLIVHWNGKTWTQAPGVSGSLSGVAATSATNAWAVGYTANDKALIVHWNGHAWTQVPSPAPAGSAFSSVAATSATNAWAVGSTTKGKALIERWNGQVWTQLPSLVSAGDSLFPWWLMTSRTWPRLPLITPGRSAPPRTEATATSRP